MITACVCLIFVVIWLNKKMIGPIGSYQLIYLLCISRKIMVVLIGCGLWVFKKWSFFWVLEHFITSFQFSRFYNGSFLKYQKIYVGWLVTLIALRKKCKWLYLMVLVKRPWFSIPFLLKFIDFSIFACICSVFSPLTLYIMEDLNIFLWRCKWNRSKISFHS